MSTQPESLRLANVCSNLTRYSMEAHLIAAELRRLHAENAALQQVYDARQLEIESLRDEVKEYRHGAGVQKALIETLLADKPAGEYPPLPTPDSYLFQHEETGVTQYVDSQQVEWGFEKNNPRLQRIGGAFTEAQMRAYVDTDRAMRAQADSQPALPEITAEDRSFLHYNPNTDDIVEWAHNYASAAITADRAMRAQAAHAAVAGPAKAAPSSFVNAAGIKATDKPITVVRKLDAAFHDAVTFQDSFTTEAEPQQGVFDEDGFRAWVIRNLPDNTIIGNSAWWADHLVAWVQRFMLAAPQSAPVAQGDAEDAMRYRFLAAHCRSTPEHWGGRWSIVVEGPAPESHDSKDDFDAAIDVARAQAKEGEPQ